MLSVVNGYLCYSSCDVKRAAQGKNPHVPDGTPASDTGRKNDKTSAFYDQAATILDGLLKDTSTANAVSAANPATDSTTNLNRPTVDLLV